MKRRDFLRGRDFSNRSGDPSLTLRILQQFQESWKRFMRPQFAQGIRGLSSHVPLGVSKERKNLRDHLPGSQLAEGPGGPFPFVLTRSGKIFRNLGACFSGAELPESFDHFSVQGEACRTLQEG